MTKYKKRISGPQLDRIDIHIIVLRVDYEKLSRDRLGETNESIVVCNAGMRVGEIRQFSSCRMKVKV